MKKQSGFGVIEVIILVVMLGIIGFGGWYLWQANQKPAEQTQAQPKEEVSEVKWLEHKDEVGKYSIKYPSNWKLENEVTRHYDDVASSYVTITSPAGAEVKLRASPGGIGGGCVPRETDRPFTPGNECASFSYLNIEKIDIGNVRVEKTSRDGKTTNIVPASGYLAKTKFMSSDGQNSTYALSLMIEDVAPKINEPEMGFVVQIPYILHLVNANGKELPMLQVSISGDSEALFKDADTEVAAQILKSFRVE